MDWCRGMSTSVGVGSIKWIFDATKDQMDGNLKPKKWIRDYFAKEKTAPKFIYAINISGLTDGDSVLDIGCGRGDLMIALAHKGANVTGIDYSKDALEIAKKAIDKQPTELKEKIRKLLFLSRTVS